MSVTVCVAVLIVASTAFGAAPDGSPVIIELFTSEGCSSCPPADALLERLEREQPVAGARIIVLSEHVDYWNRLGWADPYSSPAFSHRQEAYARRFRLDGAYTPQMVVDGESQFVGSDASESQAAAARASRLSKTAVRLSLHGPTVHVEVDALKPDLQAKTADVYLALVQNSADSQVIRGENKGRKLHHAGVVRSLTKVGEARRDGGFTADVPLNLKLSGGAASRLVVFVQAQGLGRILGAAMLPLE